MIACTSRALREELLITKTPALAEENAWKIHTQMKAHSPSRQSKIEASF
jgi:hypothetical protein